MIIAKTVFILGAGSGMDFGFPSGEELAYEISRDGPNALINDIFAMKNGFNPVKVKSFKKALSVSQLSVDAFLENRADDLFYEIGRAAIAQVLLTCEISDRLFIGKPPYEHFEKKRTSNSKTSNWYKLLWDRLVITPQMETNDITLFDRFDQNQLSIITFNYDRSLEYFLTAALTYTTGKDYKICAKKVNQSIPIVHVYGYLGPLFDGDKDVEVPYDSQGETVFVQRSWQNIDLVRQADDRNKNFKEADKLLKEAERIVFLGFGFDSTNYERLQLSSTLQAYHGTTVLGTAMGLSAIKVEGLLEMREKERDRDGNRIFTELLDTTIYDYLWCANSVFEVTDSKYKQAKKIMRNPDET